MSDKNASPETLADGSTVERDANGHVTKITSARGKVYEPKNLSVKADAELVKRVEDFRWANQMTVAEFLLAATDHFLETQG